MHLRSPLNLSIVSGGALSSQRKLSAAVISVPGSWKDSSLHCGRLALRVRRVTQGRPDGTVGAAPQRPEPLHRRVPRPLPWNLTRALPTEPQCRYIFDRRPSPTHCSIPNATSLLSVQPLLTRLELIDRQSLAAGLWKPVATIPSSPPPRKT